MIYVMYQHEVADYAKWRAVYDSKVDLRRSAGQRNERVFHGVDNPNLVTILVGWDSVEGANSWGNDPRLQTAMKDAGVLSRPTVTFL
ncbi:MAG TPA: hypothetical protein PLR07_13855, partial [Promineifilum sp.]|nr:hypothetical protein [Promineifilum sp.]